MTQQMIHMNICCVVYGIASVTECDGGGGEGGVEKWNIRYWIIYCQQMNIYSLYAIAVHME